MYKVENKFYQKVVLIDLYFWINIPIQAADKFVYLRSKLRAARIYGVELCTNKQRNLVKSKEKLLNQ